jgi:hypothetical protein
MSIASDEAAVRSYLRLLVGAPVRATDEAAVTEQGFVAAAARWAGRNGVDRRTLSGVGVPKATLDRAGLRQPSIEVLIRHHYSTTPFSVATLARRSCTSEASVRQTLADDLRAGVVEQMPGPGRATMWRLVVS